jgi:hypothetical protein
MQIAKYTAKLTVKTAMQGQQLSKLGRENEDEAVDIIQEVLLSLNSSINVGEKMSPAQIYDCSLAIFTEYWHLKIDEVMNCFKMVKNGQLGKVYGLDQPAVMKFLHVYDTEVKSEYFENNKETHQRRSRETEGEPKHIALGVEEMKKLETKN